MDIETLQIKRVTGNWDKHKNTPTVAGEPILINSGVVPDIDYPIFVLGDGTTLETIVNSGNVFVGKNIVDSLIATNNDNKVAKTNPSDVGTTADRGQLETFAREDHTHTITRDTIKGILNGKVEVNGEMKGRTFIYRTIKVGTGDPNVVATEGEFGEIYIKYDPNPINSGGK